MNNANGPKTVSERFNRKLIVVQWGAFRCMAYRDRQGKLRNFWDQKPLPLPVHILDPEQ